MGLYKGSDDEDDYASSSSEDEKKLQKYKNNLQQEDSDSEVEVYGVGSEDSEQSDIALSDVEGQEDDNLPDEKAWGNKRKHFYGTDYVDQDYGGFQGKDAQAAEFEEEEVKRLQSLSTQRLDDDHFGVFLKKSKTLQKETPKSEYSELSDKQKIRHLQHKSPEYFALIDDFKSKMAVAQLLYPIVEQGKQGKIENCKALKFVNTHYQLILNYAVNINMYLLLKGNDKLKNHPIMLRLSQYRQLLDQIEPVFEEIIKPQIDLLSGEQPKTKTRKMLKILSEFQPSKKSKSSSTTDQPAKKMKLDSTEAKTKHVTFKDVDEEIEDKEEVEEQSEEVGKRAITYQIAKNKGLTPRRKKEFRNPRVKHKIKFRKALIRRKGAVREPRTELSRYSGEISGIKSSVSKSIKIKS